MKFLTLKKSSAPPPPDPQAAEVRVYADDDGALRTIDHEGNDEAVGGGGGGGSMPITPVAPNEVAGLALWFDASQLEGLDNDDPVSTWPDLSGNGRDAEAGMGEEPIYKTNVQNGLPALAFDTNVPQYFDVPGAVSVFKNVTGGTWIAAATPDDFGSNALIWFSDGNSNDVIRASLRGAAAYLSTRDQDDGDNPCPTTFQTNSVWTTTRPNCINAFGATIDISGGFTVGRAMQSWWRDVVIGGFQGLVGHTPNTDSDNVCVGAQTTSHSGFNGFIGEIAVWPSVVTDEQLAGLIQYLIDKWAPLTP